MADHELIDESERERFAGTSAMNGRHDRDGDGVDDRREAVTGRDRRRRHRRRREPTGTLDDERRRERAARARFDRDDAEVQDERRRDTPTTRY